MTWLGRWARNVRRLLTPQSAPTEGKCGAIALRFVYKRLGARASLDDIWKAVKTPKDAPGPGVFACSGRLMCRDALDRGFQAVLVEAKYEHGLALLARARQRKVEVIFTHASLDPDWRHCSIVEGFDGDAVDVFDPAKGAFFSMSRADLLELWGKFGNEGGGHCVLAVKRAPPEPAECERCGTPIPPQIRCPDPRCGEQVPVDPGFLLGCASKECPEAAWESITCPFCGNSIEDLRTWSAW
jgi:hypothetical protein